MAKYIVHYTQYDNELMPSPIKVEWETVDGNEKRWSARVGEHVIYVDMRLPVYSIDITHMSYGVSHHSFMGTNKTTREVLLAALQFLCITHLKAVILMTGGVWPEDEIETAPLF